MNLNQIHNVYFIGIGGIGMSALARYFQNIGKKVVGYDKTPTQLTDELTAIGLAIHFEDNVNLIPEDFKTENEQRDLARFQDAMPFEDLIEAADLLLSENGLFAVVIPYKEEERFIDLCAEYELYPVKATRVKGSHKTPIVRSLLAFKRYELSVLTADELVIEINRHEYTDDYINLTQDFYLKM